MITTRYMTAAIPHAWKDLNVMATTFLVVFTSSGKPITDRMDVSFSVERSLSDLQSNIVKMQIVFQEKELPALPEDMEVLHVSQVGRIHTLIIRGNATDITNRLAVYAPILMEALPLTLEEIFIYELGGEDYAVRDIVL